MTRDEQLIRAALEMAADEWPKVRVEGGLAIAAVLAHADRIRAIDPAEVLAKVPSAWQPIENAPLGQSILIYRPTLYGGLVEIGRYDDNKFAKEPTPYWASNSSRVGVYSARANPPTHWMPLPTPPHEAPNDRT